MQVVCWHDNKTIVESDEIQTFKIQTCMILHKIEVDFSKKIRQIVKCETMGRDRVANPVSEILIACNSN